MIHDVGLRFKYSHQKFRSNSLLGLSLGCIQPDLKFDLRSKSRTTLIRSLTSDSIRSSIQNLEKLHHMICNGLWIFLFLVQCAFDAIQGLNLESWASQMVVKWKIRYSSILHTLIFLLILETAAYQYFPTTHFKLWNLRRCNLHVLPCFWRF